MTTARITHIAERLAWERAREASTYAVDSLDAEGFVHCSTPWQVASVARARFAARDDLVLLVIDPARLDRRLVFENTEGGMEPFPHVYGDIPVDAVVDVLPLTWNAERSTFPALDALRGD